MTKSCKILFKWYILHTYIYIYSIVSIVIFKKLTFLKYTIPSPLSDPRIKGMEDELPFLIIYRLFVFIH